MNSVRKTFHLWWDFYILCVGFFSCPVLSIFLVKITAAALLFEVIQLNRVVCGGVYILCIHSFIWLLRFRYDVVFMHCTVYTIVTIYNWVIRLQSQFQRLCMRSGFFLIAFEAPSENINTMYLYLLSVSCKFYPRISHHIVLVLRAIFPHISTLLLAAVYTLFFHFSHEMLVN